MDLLTKFNSRDIWLSVNGDDKIAVDAPKGALTDELRDQIRANKSELIEAMQQPWKVIRYKAARLAGELPKHFEWLNDSEILATYYTNLELLEHMDRVNVAQMVNATMALGGVVAGTVTEIPGRQAEEQPQQTELMSA